MAIFQLRTAVEPPGLEAASGAPFARVGSGTTSGLDSGMHLPSAGTTSPSTLSLLAGKDARRSLETRNMHCTRFLNSRMQLHLVRTGEQISGRSNSSSYNGCLS